MTSTSVKYFHSAMAGAPVLSGTAGALIAVLDACLVNGFNVKAVDTLTVASGVATATIGLGIGAFEADTVALVSGATPSGLNGQKRILTVDTVTNTVTFDATGISDQTATGTISIKMAPAGWEKQYAGTNKAAYRSTNPASTLAVLRVDDTAAQNARVFGFDGMTDIDTGTGQFPTSVQQSGGLYWPKSDAADATSRAWTVVADDQTVYLHTHITTVNAGISGVIFGFGDIYSVTSADAYKSMIVGSSSDITSIPSYIDVPDLTHSNSTTFYLSRAWDMIEVSPAVYTAAESYGYIGRGGMLNGAIVPQYPNPADSGLFFSRKIIYETASFRGHFRGLHFPVQSCSAAIPPLGKVPSNSGGLLMAVKGGYPAGTGVGPVVFFDIFGPWETSA